jgi:hypothetical protein
MRELAFVNGHHKTYPCIKKTQTRKARTGPSKEEDNRKEEEEAGRCKSWGSSPLA